MCARRCGLPGLKRAIGWTEECVGVRCAFGLQGAQYDTSQCRCIDKLGVGRVLPPLHQIDAVPLRHALIDAIEELQRLE